MSSPMNDNECKEICKENAIPIQCQVNDPQLTKDGGENIVLSSSSSPTPEPLKVQPSTTSSNLIPKVTKRKPVKPPSVVWDHFKRDTRDPNNIRAICNYCKKDYACGNRKNGTSNLLSHMGVCKMYPSNLDRKQKMLNFLPKIDGERGGELVSQSYNADKIREAIARIIIIDELPFSHVENEGFRYLMNLIEPRFKVPSRATVTRDCFNLYLAEKKRLKDILTQTSQRVCLTTVTWTSCQNLHYMCLTAHFIEGTWKLHKRILNFCIIPNSKGETIGKAVNQCLHDWGITRVFTITVDNAASNDVGVTHMAKKINNRGNAILKGDHMHIRCAAHILNLVVKDRLEEYSGCVTKIRDVIRYVRASSLRMAKFKNAAEKENISTKRLLCLDVPTRWNSTYLILDTAEKFEKAFDQMEDDDAGYSREFCQGITKKCPDSLDWAYARVLVKFLRVFYEATLKFSGSLYITSNAFLDQICFIKTRLKFWLGSEDENLYLMASSMISKYNKYWGGVDKVNSMMFIAMLLDPCHKERFFNFAIKLLYDNDEEKVDEAKKNIRALLPF